MSDVNANDLRQINTIDDVIATYEGVEEHTKTGLEVELAFFNPESPDLIPMSISQNKALKNASNTACGGDFARNEPTSEMLEIGSIATGPDNVRSILENAQKNINSLSNKARDMGLKRSYFQHLPDKTANQLLKNVMDVPRYQAFFAPPREDMRDIAAYFSVCKSNQVSVSYKNHDHLLSNIRRLYILAPFLFMITDNAAPLNEGTIFKGHAGMYHRTALGKRGGIPDYIYSAENGHTLIHDHIKQVMDTPLFVYYDENGELIRLKSGEWESFNSLRKKGLNTATNYYFAESILWPDIKIAALKNETDQVVGHRYEARMFGVGIHQHISAQLITAALAFDNVFANEVDKLLIKTGFNINEPQTLKAPLEKAYKSALNHNMQFLDIDYGLRNMQEFAYDFANLLENSAFLSSFEKEIEPILTICYTGYTDSKVNAILFSTLEKACDFQRNYDGHIFEESNHCAYQLFKKDLKTQSESLRLISNCIS